VTVCAFQIAKISAPYAPLRFNARTARPPANRVGAGAAVVRPTARGEFILLGWL
jgi:hypothetical protein